ncbi:head-tail adaptor protein [Defluviimonas sp. SAOS-178_SWC]|uniref:head-tail adaptor protein n=1 Tax=Defluviimonas sp. SAOS-178_SWC TaxID=3121287 RepID=UPI003221B7E6
MPAPVLIEAIAFDAPTSTDNGQGGTILGWVERLCVRAEFRFLRGGETVLQARLAGQQTIVAKIRASAASREITPEWRMRDIRTSVVYNIRSIVPTDDRHYLELTCQSGVAV